jgi:hypothetical protein
VLSTVSPQCQHSTTPPDVLTFPPPMQSPMCDPTQPGQPPIALYNAVQASFSTAGLNACAMCYPLLLLRPSPAQCALHSNDNDECCVPMCVTGAQCAMCNSNGRRIHFRLSSSGSICHAVSAFLSVPAPMGVTAEDQPQCASNQHSSSTAVSSRNDGDDDQDRYAFMSGIRCQPQ